MLFSIILLSVFCVGIFKLIYDVQMHKKTKPTNEEIFFETEDEEI